MQISFVLVEPATPENVGAAVCALKTENQTDLFSVKFNKNATNFSRFKERINPKIHDDMHLLHSFCNKFAGNQK